MDTFRVLRDCRLASGDRYRAGDEATLSAAAAKYPLMRGWIARPDPGPAEEARDADRGSLDPPGGDPQPGRRRRRG